MSDVSASRATKTPGGLVVDVDHRHEAGSDPLSRLRHRGTDRPDRLRRHGLPHDAWRAPASRCRQAARSRPGVGGGSRPAGAFDRRRAHGDHLRGRHQQCHGLGHQHARRRAWRRRRAMRRALQCDRGAAGRRRGERHADGAGHCRRNDSAGGARRLAYPRLRPSLSPARSPCATPARACRYRRAQRRGERPFRRHRARARSAACGARRDGPFR